MSEASETERLSRTSEQQGNFEEGSDYANYFCTYSFLYHQKQMLEDKRRMDGYFNAIMKNKHHFEGKVVMDVGAGSGILSIWAAMAGAKKVYGIEATQVTKNARKLVESIGLADKVTIIQAAAEDVELPEKVDVIISEWMGYFLLRESMLDSVIKARDKWLKPGGTLYPSHCTMSIGPVYSDETIQKKHQYEESIGEWEDFVKTTKERYKVDFGSLSKEYQKEHWEYFMENSLWVDLPAHSLVGTETVIKKLDLHTCKVEDFKEVNSDFCCTIRKNTYVSAFLGWFSVDFKGTEENPVKEVVTLNTAPGCSSHWGQQMFCVHPSISCGGGNRLVGKLSLTRSKENQRLLELRCSYMCAATSNKTPVEELLANSATGDRFTQAKWKIQ